MQVSVANNTQIYTLTFLDLQLNMYVFLHIFRASTLLITASNWFVHFYINPPFTGLFPNPGVPCSKPLAGSKVDSAFHPSEVDKMSTRNFWELGGKK